MCSLTVGVYSAVYLDVACPLPALVGDRRFSLSLSRSLSLSALGQLRAVGVCVAT